MSEIIATALKNMEKEEHEKQQQTLLARAVQWTYGDVTTGQWVNFNPFMNKVNFLNAFYQH